MNLINKNIILISNENNNYKNVFRLTVFSLKILHFLLRCFCYEVFKNMKYEVKYEGLE